VRIAVAALAAALLCLPALAQVPPEETVPEQPKREEPKKGQPKKADPKKGGPQPAKREQPAPPFDPNAKQAVLQGLDKVTARITNIEAPVGTTVKFAALDIVVRKCQKSRPDEQRPERAALVEIIDRGAGGQPPRTVFKGWMFASSPGLSALEHPIYDVWVVDCR
jgi:hypothetical protein